MKNKTQQKRQDTLSSGLDHFLCTLQYTAHFIQTTTHWELLVHDTQAVDIDWVQTEELQTLSTWMWVEEPTYFRQRAGRRNVTDLGARWLLCTPHWISQTPFSTFGSFNAGWTKKSDKIISCLQFLQQTVTPKKKSFYRLDGRDVSFYFFYIFTINWYFLLFSCIDICVGKGQEVLWVAPSLGDNVALAIHAGGSDAPVLGFLTMLPPSPKKDIYVD